MSNLHAQHAGYFRVAMALAVVWYLGLGIGFAVLPHSLISSEAYTLVARVVSLRAWGPIYAFVGVGLALSATVPQIPHVFVRLFTALGMLFTFFWLLCFIASAFLGYLHAFTFIPAFGLALVVEYAALIEPEFEPTRFR